MPVTSCNFMGGKIQNWENSVHCLDFFLFLESWHKNTPVQLWWLNISIQFNKHCLEVDCRDHLVHGGPRLWGWCISLVALCQAVCGSGLPPPGRPRKPMMGSSLRGGVST